MDQKTKIINFTARTFRILVAVVFGYTIYDLFFRDIFLVHCDASCGLCAKNIKIDAHFIVLLEKTH